MSLHPANSPAIDILVEFFPMQAKSADIDTLPRLGARMRSREHRPMERAKVRPSLIVDQDVLQVAAKRTPSPKMFIPCSRRHVSSRGDGARIIPSASSTELQRSNSRDRDIGLQPDLRRSIAAALDVKRGAARADGPRSRRRTARAPVSRHALWHSGPHQQVQAVPSGAGRERERMRCVTTER